MSQIKPIKKFPGEQEPMPIQPTIVIYPDPSKRGDYIAQTVLPSRQTAAILSNLAGSFMYQAGQQELLAENEAKIISPQTGKPVISKQVVNA